MEYRYVDLVKPKSEHLIAIIVHDRKKKDNLFFLDQKLKKDHCCGRVTVQHAVLLFFQLYLNKLYPTSITNFSKIAEIMYTVSQGLYKRQLCKEYMSA